MRDRKKVNGAGANVYIFFIYSQKIKSLSKESFLSAILNSFPTSSCVRTDHFCIHQNTGF